MLRKVPVIVILGSTGTGKTKLSLQLAERFGGEIISADSMQVYPGLDIVTAKATKDEQAQIKHHILDVAHPKKPFTVVHYRHLALPIVNNLLFKEKLPIIVGGTNYYIESLLWDILISEEPRELQSKSSSILPQELSGILKDQLENNLSESEILYEHLKQIDPISASKFHPNNRRKIERALEVFYEKGVPLSSIIEKQRSKPGGNRLGGPLRYPHTIILWVYCNQETLDVRLSDRINSMLKQGLIGELRGFYDSHVKNSKKELTKGVLQTIGLKEFLPYLEQYDSDHDKLVESYLKTKSYCLAETSEDLNEPESLKLLRNCLNELKTVTIRYSKKQLKWIKNRFLGYKNRQVPLIYKLDTSNVEEWNENVYKPAEEIISSYINERQTTIEPLKPLLHPGTGLNEEVSNYCEICKRHFVGEFQWQLHMKSNKHKRVKDGLRKKANISILLQDRNKDNVKKEE